MDLLKVSDNFENLLPQPQPEDEGRGYRFRLYRLCRVIVFTMLFLVLTIWGMFLKHPPNHFFNLK